MSKQTFRERASADISQTHKKNTQLLFTHEYLPSANSLPKKPKVFQITLSIQ
ncbi:hypothetical protein [Flexibacterium corallicola]|uniref:hypothetical protein n=1 Tax=Flexibacterium corallicola TaxID=3037259 RepID=UPI00286ED509|nr:hypothetical protein [Pseudovibrio sp. M1P-2-3]